MPWQAVFDATTFPRATLVGGANGRTVLGHLYASDPATAGAPPAPPNADPLSIILDAPPSTLPQATALAQAHGHALASLVHDILRVLGTSPPNTHLAPPPGMERHTLAVHADPAAPPAWTPLLGRARVTRGRGVWDFTFPPGPSGEAPPWARAAVALGHEVVLVVPRDMPLGAAAWAQLVRLGLEVVHGDNGKGKGKGRGDGGGGAGGGGDGTEKEGEGGGRGESGGAGESGESGSADSADWDVARSLSPPMNNPLRITEVRRAEARVLGTDFGAEEGTLFDRFRHAF